MALINFRYRERRRTVRVSLTVPITVHGKSGEGEKFVVGTHSQSVNRHGALFSLELPVTIGQQLLLVNDHTTHSVECRVINVRPGARRQKLRGRGVRQRRQQLLAHVVPHPGLASTATAQPIQAKRLVFCSGNVVGG